MTRALDISPSMSRRRRVATAAVASVAALNLGGCGLELLSALGSITSIASLDPTKWFSSDEVDYEAGLPEPSPRVEPQAGAMLRIAEASRARGDFISAASFYQRAAAMDPADPAPLSGLGQVFLEAGDPERASAAFRAALRLDPERRDALHGLGNALIILDEPDLAAAQFHAANAIRPEARTYNGLGVALDMRGDHELAQSVYRQGLKLEPGSLSLRNNLGLSLALAGAHDEAITVLREVASLPHATARERQNLALAYGLAGDSEMAARLSRIDLTEAQVASNLDYYAWLRDQPQSAAAVMLGKAPAGGETSGERALDAELANKPSFLPQQRAALPD